jgi:hypothetical protein
LSSLPLFEFYSLSLIGNNIGDDLAQRIENALKINRNLFQIWTQRKHFLTFISQLSLPLPSDDMNVNVVRLNVLNVRKVLELEEMKREITKYL